MAENAMQDYVASEVKFNRTEKEDKYAYLMTQKERLKKFNSQTPYIMTLNAKTICNIINKYDFIEFEDALTGTICIIESARLKSNGKVVLLCRDKNEQELWERYPYAETIFCSRSFINFKPQEFADRYLRTVEKTLSMIQKRLDALQKEIEADRETIAQKFADDNAELKTTDKEAKVVKVTLDTDQAETLAKSRAGVRQVSNQFKIGLSPEERYELMSWICTNILSIRIYAEQSGRSGNLLDKNYTNSGAHFRQPKYNAEGKKISCDSMNGHISFKSVELCPTEILKKVCTSRHNDELFSGQNKKRLNDINLALFLIVEFKQYGFVAGKKDLWDSINKEQLLEDLK